MDPRLGVLFSSLLCSRETKSGNNAIVPLTVESSNDHTLAACRGSLNEGATRIGSLGLYSWVSIQGLCILNSASLSPPATPKQPLRGRAWPRGTGRF